MTAHDKSTEIVLNELSTDKTQGLSQSEAASRIEKYGENRLQEKKKKSTLQRFLDAYLTQYPSAKIDYIHGEDSLVSLANQDGAVGFLFGGMEKSELFSSVAKDGALPRKTFSMGEAYDKRYYLEARMITK